MRKGGSKKPAATSKSNLGLTVATIFVALTSGLLASAGLISGGTSDAMSIAWRVDGTVTFVSALKPGDG